MPLELRRVDGIIKTNTRLTHLLRLKRKLRFIIVLFALPFNQNFKLWHIKIKIRFNNMCKIKWAEGGSGFGWRNINTQTKKGWIIMSGTKSHHHFHHNFPDSSLHHQLCLLIVGGLSYFAHKFIYSTLLAGRTEWRWNVLDLMYNVIIPSIQAMFA